MSWGRVAGWLGLHAVDPAGVREPSTVAAGELASLVARNQRESRTLAKIRDRRADVCIYCVNWCFRLPSQGMNESVREEIRFEFVDWLRDLQYHGEGYREGKVFESWGIFFVPNPCGTGRA